MTISYKIVNQTHHALEILLGGTKNVDYRYVNVTKPKNWIEVKQVLLNGVPPGNWGITPSGIIWVDPVGHDANITIVGLVKAPAPPTAARGGVALGGIATELSYELVILLCIVVILISLLVLVILMRFYRTLGST